MIAKKIIITGDVQGVFYRHNAKKEAVSLGVAGWTKNEHDGSVSIIAQGEEESVKNLVKWARKGSEMATVKNVEIKEIELSEDLKGFLIK